MKKIVIIPDSFKGTMSSSEICSVMKQKIAEIFPCAEVVAIPVADGGEGSVDCFLSAVGGEKVYAECSGPYGERIEGFYALLKDGKTAVIEMAVAAGLPMVENRKNPLLTTTYGVGELIKHALERGAKKIILALGGSCTNDFGCGASCALGVEFFDKDGNSFVPTGGTLERVERINLENKTELLSGVEMTVMCDIDNPPYGKSGASFVFAPQKGADEKTVKLLDDGVKNLCKVIKRDFNKDLSALKGGGAAGAMGAGMNAFFGSPLMMGIDTVLQTVGFSEIISSADLVFTGEGKIDAQSLGGKVVIGVARECKKQAVPVVAVVGGAEGDLAKAYDEGVTAIFTINRLPVDLSISKHHSRENLAFSMENILRLLKNSK